jgi:hypothetical protein
VVVTPEFEEPTCDISLTLTFREPTNSGKCIKPNPTPYARRGRRWRWRHLLCADTRRF